MKEEKKAFFISDNAQSKEKLFGKIKNSLDVTLEEFSSPADFLATGFNENLSLVFLDAGNILENKSRLPLEWLEIGNHHIIIFIRSDSQSSPLWEEYQFFLHLNIDADEKQLKMILERAENHRRVRSYLNAFFNTSKEGVLVFNQRGRIIALNRRVEKILMQGEADILDKNIQNFIGSDQKSRFEDWLREVRQWNKSGREQGISPLFLESRVQRQNSSHFHAEIKLSFFRSQGRPLGFFLIQDISERHQSEKMFLQLAKFTQENPNPIMRVSRKAYFLSTNRPGEELIQYFEANQEAYNHLRTIVTLSYGSGQIFREEIKMAEKYFKLIIVPIQQEQYLNIYGEDITALKLLSREKEEAEDHFSILYEQSKDMIYTTDADGIIKKMNPAGIMMLGFKQEEEILGKNIADYYLTEQSRQSYLRQMRKEGAVHDLELFFITARQKIFVGQESAVQIKSNNKVVEYFGIVKDITERIRKEHFQIKSNLELEELNRELKNAQSSLIQQEKMATLGQLAAGIAHEINNPLGFIKSNFHSIKNYLQKIEGFLATLEKMELAENPGFSLIKKEHGLDWVMEDLSSLFSETEDGFTRIINIIHNLKLFSRSDSEDGGDIYDLNSGVRSTLVIAKNEYKYVAEVETDLQENLPALQVSSNRINQVILNLLINAAQAIASQKRKEPGRIFIRTYQNGDKIGLEIEDDGPGVPEEIREDIFEPFFTSKKAGKGTGLGLSISQSIITQHGGKIQLRNKPAGGAIFSFELTAFDEETEGSLEVL